MFQNTMMAAETGRTSRQLRAALEVAATNNTCCPLELHFPRVERTWVITITGREARSILADFDGHTLRF